MFRPAETALLVGDSTKARHVLGWQAKVCMDQLIEEMVWGDCGQFLGPSGNPTLPDEEDTALA